MMQANGETGAQGYQTLPAGEASAAMDAGGGRFVLVEPSHPGNIGAAARAMKTMGLDRLYLVNPPADYPSAEATAMASGADDLLAQAVICRSLEQAIAGCHLVMGTSARSRTLDWPTLTPRQCAARAAAECARGGEVAVLFGREKSGLSNEELERCHYRVHIPANPDFSSLNLAAAVQILAYEFRLTTLETQPVSEPDDDTPADALQVERFFEHLQQALVDIEFLDPRHPRQVMRRLRRLFARTRLLTTEVNILRGILTAAQRQARLASRR